MSYSEFPYYERLRQIGAALADTEKAILDVAWRALPGARPNLNAVRDLSRATRRIAERAESLHAHAEPDAFENWLDERAPGSLCPFCGADPDGPAIAGDCPICRS